MSDAPPALLVDCVASVLVISTRDGCLRVTVGGNESAHPCQLDPDLLMPCRLCECALHANAPILAVPAALEAPFATVLSPVYCHCAQPSRVMFPDAERVDVGRCGIALTDIRHEAWLSPKGDQGCWAAG